MVDTIFSERGITGLRREGGIVQEEYLRELSGDRWLATVREMADDPIIGAVLFAVEMLLRRVPLNIQPADDSAQSADAARFVEQCLGDMSLDWRDILAEILTMLPYGWSYLELVYKRRGGDTDSPESRSRYSDGRIGWRKWSIRSQETRERWEFDETGGIQGMWQRVDGGALVLIPIEKALLFRTNPRKGNPEGRSILRSAYRAWWFKRNLETVEGVGVERDLAGLPVAKVPPGVLGAVTEDEQRQLAAIKEIVTNIRRDEQEGVVWPLVYDDAGRPMYELELLSSGGARSFDTGAIIQRYEQRMAMTVLADFILLGHEAVGSYALSATKSSMFKSALEAWLESVAAVINTHAVPRLLRLNGMDVRLAPRVEFGAVGSVDVETVIQFVSSMAAAGMTLFPSPELENKLRGDVGLPLLSEEEQRRRMQEAEREPSPPPAPEPDPPANRPDTREMAAMLEAAGRILQRGTYGD